MSAIEQAAAIVGWPAAEAMGVSSIAIERARPEDAVAGYAVGYKLVIGLGAPALLAGTWTITEVHTPRRRKRNASAA